MNAAQRRKHRRAEERRFLAAIRRTILGDGVAEYFETLFRMRRATNLAHRETEQAFLAAGDTLGPVSVHSAIEIPWHLVRSHPG
jgi:hypothetical protein